MTNAPLRLEMLHDAHGVVIGQRVEITDLGHGTIAGTTYRFALVTLDGGDDWTPVDPGALSPRPKLVPLPEPAAPVLRHNTPAQDEAMQRALAVVDREHAELCRERDARRMATARRAA